MYMGANRRGAKARPPEIYIWIFAYVNMYMVGNFFLIPYLIFITGKDVTYTKKILCIVPH